MGVAPLQKYFISALSGISHIAAMASVHIYRQNHMQEQVEKCHSHSKVESI